MNDNTPMPGRPDPYASGLPDPSFACPVCGKPKPSAHLHACSQECERTHLAGLAGVSPVKRLGLLDRHAASSVGEAPDGPEDSETSEAEAAFDSLRDMAQEEHDPIEDFLSLYGSKLGLEKHPRSLTADWCVTVVHIAGHVYLSDEEDGTLALFVHVKMGDTTILQETLQSFDLSSLVEMKALAQAVKEIQVSAEGTCEHR